MVFGVRCSDCYVISICCDMYSQTGQWATTHFLLPNAQRLFNKQTKKRTKKLLQDLSYYF